MKFVDICVALWIYTNANNNWFLRKFLSSKAIYIKREETFFFHMDSSFRLPCDVYSALNEDKPTKKYYITWNWHSITEIRRKQIIEMSNCFYCWFYCAKEQISHMGNIGMRWGLVFTCLIVNLANLNYWPNPSYFLSPIHLTHTFSCTYITMPQTL